MINRKERKGNAKEAKGFTEFYALCDQTLRHCGFNKIKV